MSSKNDLRQNEQQQTKVFELFVGSHIHLFIKNIKMQVEEGAEGVVMQGILLDECRDFYYISGDGGHSVSAAIKKIDVAAITVADLVEHEVPGDYQ